MINRELIRLKVVQIAYSCHQSGNRSAVAAEKELLLSLSKAYDLYNFLLLLMVEVSRMALRMYEIRQNRARRLGEDTEINAKFVNNKFMLQLESNKQLRQFRDNMSRSWADNESFVRDLYNKVEESDFYQQYMESPTSTYQEDRELWRLIYRHLICNNEELDSILEEMSLYWNDDKVIVDTFVLKTINRFTAESNASQPLLPEYRSDADREFAISLLRRTLSGSSYYDELISATTRRWELERIALMDRIIMHVALAEIISFPSIPLSVSISEYVEIALMYSTPKSGKYVNAALDTIAKTLQSENRLVKDEQAAPSQEANAPLQQEQEASAQEEEKEEK